MQQIGEHMVGEYVRLVPGTETGGGESTATHRKRKKLLQQFDRISRQINEMRRVVEPPISTTDGLDVFGMEMESAVQQLEELHSDVVDVVTDARPDRLLLALKVYTEEDAYFCMLGIPKINVLLPVEDDESVTDVMEQVSDLRIQYTAERLTEAKWELLSKYPDAQKIVVYTYGTGMTGGKLKGKRPLMYVEDERLCSIDLMSNSDDYLEVVLEGAVLETNFEYYCS